jgi:hypothetical protein
MIGDGATTFSILHASLLKPEVFLFALDATTDCAVVEMQRSSRIYYRLYLSPHVLAFGSNHSKWAERQRDT